MKSEFSQIDINDKIRQKALDDGLKRLNSRIRTERELRLWLAGKEYAPEIINKVIEEIKDLGYLDDEEYCRQYFFYAKKKGKADYRILAELEEKGIHFSKAKEIFSEIRSQDCEDGMWGREDVETDERKLATEIGKKMMRNHLDSGRNIDDKFMGKVSRRLASLGYPSSMIYHVIDTLWKQS